MKRIHVLAVAKNLTEQRHRILGDAIRCFFAWAEIEDRDSSNDAHTLIVSRRDDRCLSVADQYSLKCFVAGFLSYAKWPESKNKEQS